MDVWVGRKAELGTFVAAVDKLEHGEGSVVWVQGVPGIGKSSLIVKGVAAARDRGYQVLSGTADQLSRRVPLQVMLDCLQVRPHAPEPRAGIARIVRQCGPGELGTREVVPAATELLVRLVEDLCAASPTVIAIDDLQWTDDASLGLWRRLALMVPDLPLLLVGACEPGSRREELQGLPAALRRRGGTVLSLSPLDPSEVTELVAGLTGRPPGATLRELATQALGNPLYLGELIDAFSREQHDATGSPAGPAAGGLPDRVSASVAAALNERLNLLPPTVADLLSAAALLGDEFEVSELATLLRRRPSELAADLRDAMSAGIIVEVGPRLALRHPSVRLAVYDRMPTGLRRALHGEAAQTLAAAGGAPLRVAQQLLLADQPGDRWAHAWLGQAAPTLSAVAPDLTVELLQRELAEPGTGGSNRDALAVSLARALLGTGRHEQAAARARRALTVVVEPDLRAETNWILAHALYCLGHDGPTSDVIERALSQPGLSDRWRARLLASLAMVQRADPDTADAHARHALDTAQRADDAFATAHAMTSLWLSHSERRDHVSAMRCLDAALSVLDDEPAHADLRAFLLDGRVRTLQDLDRWSDAEAALRHARALAGQADQSHSAASSVTAAVLFYWLGRWDDASNELAAADRNGRGVTYAGLSERGLALRRHGLAAIIAGRRDERVAASEHLREASETPLRTRADRRYEHLLLVARALAFEQDGDPAAAAAELSKLLGRRAGAMAAAHQWHPSLVRLALMTGDRATARAAVRACSAEAAAQHPSAQAAVAALRCQGLFDCDPEPLRTAVAHYRRVGTLTVLAAATEDLAAVLAAHGSADEAKSALNQAIDLYGDLGAKWDIRRAEHRLRRHGIRRGVRGSRSQHAPYGWEALTPTELRITSMVAQGLSTPVIARQLLLSRRTVQTHISHVLGKLGMHSRMDIAREVIRRQQAG
ncbi:MAG: ATP-binding protein [Gaiellaceae bacterium]